MKIIRKDDLHDQNFIDVDEQTPTWWVCSRTGATFRKINYNVFENDYSMYQESDEWPG